MNKLILIRSITAALMAGALFTACKSEQKKADDAQVKVEAAKEDLKEVQNEAAVAAQKAATAEDWKMFKDAAELKIKENETRIAELKEKMKKAGKTVDAMYANSIAALEQKNTEMRNRIGAYEKSQSDWDTFKREFEHDMEGIGQAFKDLTVNNKK